MKVDATYYFNSLTTPSPVEFQSLMKTVSFLVVPIRVLVPISVPIYTKNDKDKSVNDIDKSVL